VIIRLPFDIRISPEKNRNRMTFLVEFGA